MAVGTGDVVYVGWVHTHPAGAGDYRDFDSGDTGAPADSVEFAFVNFGLKVKAPVAVEAPEFLLLGRNEVGSALVPASSRRYRSALLVLAKRDVSAAENPVRHITGILGAR